MLKIAIKDLAYFSCRSGNLTLESFSNKDLAIGKKIHSLHQNKYNDESKKEVYIKKEFSYFGDKILLHGFIDGLLVIDDEIILEEIKTTNQDLETITGTEKNEYLAQLKLYSYLYALEHDYKKIHTRLTYISVVDYEEKNFDTIYDISALEEFTFDCLEKYLEWEKLIKENANLKEKTIKEIKFPYENMRRGQRDMMKASYHALKNNDILYVIAPTGIGKTMGTLFAGLKTLENNDKLFYLTAKGSGKNAPIDAVKLLAQKGLKLKTINLIAKKKICNANFKNCNPDDCPFALGFYDRLNLARKEIYENYDIFDEETILEIANKHKICSFEFSLDLSYYCDLIIADYNYVFDPKAHLTRYFDDDTYTPKILVDEAHNLISRSKEMYSSSICDNDIRNLRRLLNSYKPSIRKECNDILEIFENYNEQLALKSLVMELNLNSELYILLKHLVNKIDNIFLDNKKIVKKDEILDYYFKVLAYTQIAEYFTTSHRLITKKENNDIINQIMCLDASDFILDTIKTSTKGIVFFSATLVPFEYHANLLTKGEGKFLELESPFNPNNLDIIINDSISTKYKQRESSIDYIIESIEIITSVKKGNYIVFFPSYQYLNMVVNAINDCNYEMIVQRNDFNEKQRNEIIEKFKNNANCKVGFFVMGGIFSEGIDFVGDYLNGVIIIGVGLPMYNDENNILKDYFNVEYQNGFDYAYTYPGLTKVIQAVGRVIRSETDKGIALLIDERFNTSKYFSLMPKHWQNKKIIRNSYDLKKEIKKFYLN